ncbi:SKP1 component protein [Fadolivirus algeromassiliense]|jgi:hypothetical protein|uniref:SKP1 component protein n=1 Tax=Fadolivirus FV1/VV64 TaxID=3070911 RepID=A0A7D3V5J4_9VIRU|nr:SKP1 component protein [Fadolivirus algeromassiliense]QKF94095.1 SKP1 component protein [Fadolivirus FV1/VV64]
MTSINYKIILEGGYETAVAEDMLNKIPGVKKLIENIKKNDKILDKKTLNMDSINQTVFSTIMTLIKYQSDKSETETTQFINTMISNMDSNILMEFILTTNKLELDYFKQIAANRFMNIIKSQNINEIRKELKIKNDFTDKEMENVKKDNKWLDE